jgi:hypothetical protein
MNKRFVISVVVIFIVSVAGGMLVHGTILASEYTKLANAGIYRTPEQAHPLMGFMMLGQPQLRHRPHVDLSHRTRQPPWLGQGLRFGLRPSPPDHHSQVPSSTTW